MSTSSSGLACCRPVLVSVCGGQDGEAVNDTLVILIRVENSMQVVWSKEASLDDFVALLCTLPQRQRDVLELRHGMHNGRAQTLERIGRQLKVTKERVRQIEKQAMNELHSQGVTLGRVSQQVRGALESAGGVARLEHLTQEVDNRTSGGALSLGGLVRLILRLDPEIIKARINGIGVWALGGSPVATIPKIRALCTSMLRDARLGLSFEVVVTRILEELSDPRMDRAFVAGVIRACPGVIVSDNVWLFHPCRKSGPRLVKIIRILRQAGQALHFSELTERLNKEMEKQSSLLAVYELLRRNPEFFVRVARGTFGLREWESQKFGVIDLFDSYHEREVDPMIRTAMGPK